MTYSTRDYQIRVNGIFNAPILSIDGAMGPKTRKGIDDAMKLKGVKNAEDLFTKGVRGIVWHWTAGAHGVIDLERHHYNWIFDNLGNVYAGNNSVQDQVNYNSISGVGGSHTKSMNTGWIGLSVDAMAGAIEYPFNWGTNPLTWEGVDAMLKHSMKLCKEYNIPVSPWTTLSHAEVQPTLNVPQRFKWDYKVLPGYTSVKDPRIVGDEMRKRMLTL